MVMGSFSGKMVANTEATTIEEWEKVMDSFIMDRRRLSVVVFGIEECCKVRVSINSRGVV